MPNIALNPNDFLGIAIVLVVVGLGFRLAPRNVSVAGHDAGQLFLLAALPLFFIDFGTSAEYATGELITILSEHNLQQYAWVGVLAVGFFNLAFGALYIYALGVFRDGGGASTAALRYLGPTIAILVSFLLIADYTLTVVVSSLSGADQLLSIIGAYSSAGAVVHIALGVGIAWLTCWLTLRGRRDAARITFVVLWTYVVLMIITFVSLGLQLANNTPPPAPVQVRPIPVPSSGEPVFEIAGLIGFAVLHGLVALTGLEAVSNGLPFIKNEDANYVKWAKKRMPQFSGFWKFMSGRVGVGRTIQIGFLFYGGLTMGFNAHFANSYGIVDGTYERTLVGNLAYIGLFPIGGTLLFAFRQIWSSLTLSFANMTAYEDMQSTAYRDGVRGLLPLSLVYRSPNGNFPRPVLMTFILAVIIILIVGGNTKAAIPLYGIGVFAPIGFMGFSVVRHLQVTKPKGYRAGAVFAFAVACMAVLIFVSQIITKFGEGGWLSVVVFVALFVFGHVFLLSARGERFDKLGRYFITSVSRMHGTMAELLLWQTHMMQTYRSNVWRRLTHWHTGDQRPLELAPYPEYQVHYDADEHDYLHEAVNQRGQTAPESPKTAESAEAIRSELNA